MKIITDEVIPSIESIESIDKTGADSFNPTLFTRLAERILTTVLRVESQRYLSFKPTNLTTLPTSKGNHSATLYAHVPFCESLCPYCSFNRFVLNQAKAKAYFKTLREEMRILAGLGYKFTSMYIGGGTPTILSEELAQTIDLARELFGVNEVSCETNPNHLTPEIIDLFKHRIQRLSVGVQSFNDDLLKQMNRFEKFGSGREIAAKIRAAAPYFESLNVDMIFNFPSQTPEILREDLRMVSESGAQQTTFYPLMTSQAVSRSMANSVGELKPDREADFYKIVVEGLSEHFRPMSAWTFGRNGTRILDEYIVNSEEYVGVGSGVFSYLDGTLYVSTFSLRDYEKKVASGKMGITGVQHYNQHQQMRYRMMMDLFSLNFDRRGFTQRFGVSPARRLWLEMLFLNLAGAFTRNARHIPTPTGRYLSVAIMREFFSGVNRLRDISRAQLSVEDRGN